MCAVSLHILFGHTVVTSRSNVSELIAATPTSTRAAGASNQSTSAHANTSVREQSPLRPVSNFLMATVIVNGSLLTRPYHTCVGASFMCC